MTVEGRRLILAFLDRWSRRDPRRFRATARRRHLAAALALALGVALLAAPRALAAQQLISSTGPLTSVYLNDNLACSATHIGDTHPDFFGGTDPGACGTFLSTGDTSYGPVVPAGNPSRTEFTPVSQSGVTGDGTAADPFKVLTVVDAGTTGLSITQTDTYVSGQESYRTDVTVANRSRTTIDASLYHAGDCYLQGSDSGFGAYDPDTGGVFCALSANNAPPARIVGFVPLSAGSHFIESSYGSVWAAVDAAGTQLPDTWDGDLNQDDGAALSWALSVPPGGSATRGLITTFSPTGVAPGTTPPDTALSAGPAQGSTTTVTTPSFAFTSDQAGSTFECRVDGDAFAACVSPFTTAPLALGRHTFEVRAINSAQQVDPTPAASTFTVAAPPAPPPPPAPTPGPTPAPPAPSATGSATTAQRAKTFSGTVGVFTDATGLGASAYDVTIDWGDGTTTPGSLRPRGVGGQFDVVGTHTYLLGGSYTTRVRVVQRGTTRVAQSAGSVAVSGPTVKVGKSFIAAKVSGTVRYQRPGARKFVTLGKGRSIPVGSLIDTRTGRVRITWTTGRPSDVRVVDHYAGLFRLAQERRVGALIDARLAGSLVGCRPARTAAFEARRRRRGRRLWGSGRGGRTTGRAGAATVRGTIWLTQDGCKGSTTVRVVKGVVSVRDFVRRKTVTVKAGRRYTTGKRPLP